MYGGRWEGGFGSKVFICGDNDEVVFNNSGIYLWKMVIIGLKDCWC